ncbi:TPA: hypothetical protein UM690_002651 [Stenotrophomonas maltophilia]|nr:hypothetical protein [Stenotrophomonas maltophilia]HEL4289939.1 hypothetical protein [Stenotrophomonas maltophilia]
MKIVAAVNAMISRPDLIGSSVQGTSTNEFFFLYNGKFKWSILANHDDVAIFFYTGSDTIEDLAQIDSDSDPDAWEHIKFVRYSARDIGTKEASDTFSDLMKIVKEKQFGVSDALDEIIMTAEWQKS